MRCFLLAGSIGALLTLAGCGSAPQHTIGKPTSGASPHSVGTLLTTSALPSAPVRLQGTMVEKCPSSGCWLRLKDASGTIKVDLRATGATAAEIAPGTEITVTGTALRIGGDLTVEASGMTY